MKESLRNESNNIFVLQQKLKNSLIPLKIFPLKSMLSPLYQKIIRNRMTFSKKL
jgi:hypothetical protein